ncbi:hypothetical protein TRVL_04206 [Trypanosoma vivax]|nr:hypothetical protein TRVL_04206 [Trypanosoma vivax]
MTRRWVFTRAATGLLCNAQCLMRTRQNEVLLDAEGQPMESENALTASTVWRTHRAFSGRCGLCVSDGEVSAVSESAEDYRAGEVNFCLRSAGKRPHVLISLVPHYVRQEKGEWNHDAFPCCLPTAVEQDEYDRKMMETPLIWEEPLTFSVECTADGMYVWSDECGVYGEKVSSVPCFTPRDQNEYGKGTDDAKCFEALVGLSWKDTTTGSPHAEDDQLGRRIEVMVSQWSTFTEDNAPVCNMAAERICVVRRVMPCTGIPSCVYFVPFITLMDDLDSATIVQNSEATS